MTSFLFILGVMLLVILIRGVKGTYWSKENKFWCVFYWVYSAYGIFNLIRFTIKPKFTASDIFLLACVGLIMIIIVFIANIKIDMLRDDRDELMKVAEEQSKLINTLTQTYVDDKGDMFVSLSGRTKPCREKECTYPNCNCNV